MTAATKRAPGASAEAIQFHYDLSNEFYRLWLDPEMVYSCALWRSGDEDLSAAQINKLDWHLDHCGISAGQRLLEVGCGWGGLLHRAVSRIGVGSAVGLTLSKRQAEYVQRRNIPGVEVRLENWFDHAPEETYDGVVSIAAFEAFARLGQTEQEKLDGYRQFFAFCHRMLRSGGGLSLQTVTYELADQKEFSPFIEQHIFPESDLPHLEEIVKASRGFFEIKKLRNDGQQYARTLRCWQQNLRNRRTEAIALVGEENFTRFDKYLGMAIVGFHTRNSNLVRIGMQRIDATKTQ